MDKRNVLKVISASLVIAMCSAPMAPVADFFNVGTTITANAVAGDIIKSGPGWKAYKTDTEGECEIVLEGTITKNSDIRGVPKIYWQGIKNIIGNNTIKKISAKEGTKFVGNCEGMFRNDNGSLSDVTEIDLSNVDTSELTSMKTMFYLNP